MCVRACGFVNVFVCVLYVCVCMCMCSCVCVSISPVCRTRHTQHQHTNNDQNPCHSHTSNPVTLQILHDLCADQKYDRICCKYSRNYVLQIYRTTTKFLATVIRVTLSSKRETERERQREWKSERERVCMHVRRFIGSGARGFVWRFGWASTIPGQNIINKTLGRKYFA